jgi:hypothetical protein
MDFASPQRCKTCTQPPIQWKPGAPSLGIKRPGREADHSPPSSAEVKGVELYHHSPNTPSWRGAQLKRSAGTTLPLSFVLLHRKHRQQLSNSMEQADNHSTSQEIPRLLWDPKFITLFKGACHWSLSWARCIHSRNIHCSYILPSTTKCPTWSLPFRFPDQNFVQISRLSQLYYMPRPSHPSWSHHPNNVWWSV